MTYAEWKDEVFALAEAGLYGVTVDDVRGWLSNDYYEKRCSYGTLYSPEDFLFGHKYLKLATHNRTTVQRAKRCGCYYCLEIFNPQEVDDYTPECDGECTVFCPYCKIDSVVPETESEVITRELLRRVHVIMFSSDR